MGYAGYCGDGLINGPEICDDGAGVNSDDHTNSAHCNANCTMMIVEYCGDGICQVPQESNGLCAGDCTTCGDGIIQEPDEECDERGDTDTCNGDCTFHSCGDGYLNMAAGEECDDGNQDDTDACRNDCTNALCGDGIVQVGVEECDDGNQKDDDECSDACITARRVFVSAEKWEAAAIQGVAGADDHCKIAALPVAGLGAPGNTWVAWLSDDSSSPSIRVPAANKSFSGWYLLPNGTPIAKGWSGLTSGTLVNPITLTETEAIPVDPLATWTNTKPDGTSGGLSDCSNWTVSDVKTGVYGDIIATTAAWTQAGILNCSAALHIYCLEVSP
jgi:cysteine-rich repeat protein